MQYVYPSNIKGNETDGTDLWLHFLTSRGP